jgi:hypothetical protein
MKTLLFLLLALTVCCSIGGLTGVAFAQTKGEICDNGIDDDGDKLVDCDDPDCTCKPPDGTPCSPGFWKNHLSLFNQFCAAAAALDPTDQFDDCADLLTALTCRGSDASCGRSAAAALLNTASGGCTE